MRSILLTITTEQLQKSINELETKVSNLDNLKEVQDKIISYQDHQISFLNDSIANMWTPVAIVAGVIGAVFIYVSYLNRQAKTKMDEAEKALNKAETKIQDLNTQLRQAADVVQEAKAIAATAQNKLNELETEQKQLQLLTDKVQEVQNLNMKFTQGNSILNFIKMNRMTVIKHRKKLSLTQEEEEFIDTLNSRYEDLSGKFRVREFLFNKDVVEKGRISSGDAQSISDLYRQLSEVNEKMLTLLIEIDNILLEGQTEKQD